MGCCNSFRKRIDTLEIFAVVSHYLAGAPQIVKRQRTVLAAAIAVSPFARRHLEVAIADRAAFTQDVAHFDDGFSVFETSAKTGESVEEAFQRLAEAVQ